MPRRFTGVLSPPSLAALLALLLVTATLRSQTAAQKPHIAVPFNQVSLLTLQCTANPTSALAGEIIMIQALGTSFQKLPLQYSFSTNAGQIEQKGSVALLRTNGLAPQIVHVTCYAADNQGRRESQGIAITIMAAKVESGTIHLPASPPKQTAPPVVIAPHPVETPATATKPAYPAKPPSPTPTEAVHEPKPPSQPPTETTAPAPSPVQIQAPPKPVKAAHPSGQGAPPLVTQPTQPMDPQSAAQPSPPADQQSPTGAKPPDEYQQSESVQQWVDHLRQGKIEYQVPTRMTIQVPSTVTVVIHGYENVGATTLSQATGSGSLKQSELMKVELLAPANPGAFTIGSQNGDDVRFVPINGTATWMWTVTPNTAGNNLQLEVRASVIYPGGSDKTEQQVETYDATVAVAVQPFWSTAWDYVREHPLQVLGYLIPGGAGFTFLAGLIVWWWKQRHKGESDEAAREKATVPRSSKPPQRKRRS